METPRSHPKNLGIATSNSPGFKPIPADLLHITPVTAPTLKVPIPKMDNGGWYR